MADANWERTVVCKDGSRRPKGIRVYISEENDVAVQSPPGEVGLLSPRGVSDLMEVLRAAQIEALHRGRLG